MARLHGWPRAFAGILIGGLVGSSAGPLPTRSFSIRVHEGTTLGFDLSPDGKSIVFDLLGQLWELPGGGGTAVPLTDAVRDTAEDLDPSWSPDGKRIVFRAERGGRVGLWILERGAAAPRQLTQLANPDGFDGQPAWSSDGRAIAFSQLLPPDSATRFRSRLVWIDPAGGAVQELPVDSTIGRFVAYPAWEPHGRRLVVVAAPPGSRRGGRLWLIERATGAAAPLGAPGTAALAPAFAPDGKRVAFFAPDSAGRVQVWIQAVDSSSTAPHRLTDQGDVTPTRVRWSANGRSLAYGADGRLWRIPDTGGAPEEIPFSATLSISRPRLQLPPPSFPEPGRQRPVRAFMGLALSPDARNVGLLALGKLWVMPVGGTPRAVADVPLDAKGLAWSPDGTLLAWSAGSREERDLFATEVASGLTRRLTALPGTEDHPMYSPDGKHLAFSHTRPAGDSTWLRVAEVASGSREIVDSAAARPLAANVAAAAWSPGSDGLLVLTGGFAPTVPTRAAILTLSGERRAVSRPLDSPLDPQWAAGSLVFVRHARLWGGRLDPSGTLGQAEPLGTAAAIYPSAARDGSILFISEGGLRLRAPDGREQRLGWPLSYTPPVGPSLLIRNARIVDGTGAPPTPARDLLIERGRIERIAAAGTLRGAERIMDAGGGFLIPGLVDLHAHEYRPELMPAFPFFGVTTIRDQGSPIGPLVAYADAVAAGLLAGPRVDYGGIQFYTDWAYDLEDGQGVEPEADPDHVARAVALAAAFGSGHIKTRTFRRWDINARFIAEAHRHGMRVTGHCAHPLPLVAAGMDAKEHGGFCSERSDGTLYDDMVQLYRAAGIGVVPTISYSSLAVRLNQHPDAFESDSEVARFLPPRESFEWMIKLDSAGRRLFTGFAEQARRAAARLARAGVTIGTGTDVWQTPIAVHIELEELVAAGLSPLEALRAATQGAARIIGAERDFGTIEPGKWADLVLLDADPSADIRNTRRIRSVVQAGLVLDRDAIRMQVQKERSTNRP